MKIANNRLNFLAGILITVGVMISCQSSDHGRTGDQSVLSLKGSFEDDFYVGAALGFRQLIEENEAEAQLIAREFSSLTGENCMKWERIHPQPDSFNFEMADKLVEIAERNDQYLIGHTLVWHNQVPGWVFSDDQSSIVDSTELFRRMKKHISTVVERYRGKVKGWDVVNEALNEDGTLRQSKFYLIANDEYIFKAFQYAAEADPDMDLYYNDYNMHLSDKVDGAIEIARRIRERGLKIDGIGMQGHWALSEPTIEEIETSILKIHGAGLKVMITELDIDVLPSPVSMVGASLSDKFEVTPENNPYAEGLPDSVEQIHAQRYMNLFALFLKHSDKVERVTFWGVHDGNSWKNNWPARGRTNYCLVFDRNIKPKPAYQNIVGLKNQDN